MKILGISAYYHDSAAAITIDGKVTAAAQEERFTRIKHDASFPIHACLYCLQAAGLSITELDAVVFYDKPLLKFERLLETYYRFAPRGLPSFLAAIPVWVKEKLFLRKMLNDEMKALGAGKKDRINWLFPEHHLSHAASAFYPSPYQEAAIITIDGVGEWATASICHGKGNDISILKELRFPHSLGLLYSAFTYFLGFTVNSGEYKLMGLAPYGNPDSDQVKIFADLICKQLVDLKEDGSLWMNQAFFSYATGLRMIREKKWEQLFGFPRRKPESQLEQHHCDLALAIQQVTEQAVMGLAREAGKLTGSENLCIAGGVGLNCVANGKLLKTGTFKNLYIQPAAGDAGGALGAALAAEHIYFKSERKVTMPDSLEGSYLGPEFSDLDVKYMVRKYNAISEYIEDVEELSARTARILSDGHVVGWFQGRMEFGPRALGNRSILADPRNTEMQRDLNLKIKFREGFRPFAPAVLAEDVSEYFKLQVPSPYMLLVAPVADHLRQDLPEDYHQLDMVDRLSFKRSKLPSITHVDFSARVQTVHQETNIRFWKLINQFKKITNTAVLVNTSFNVRGEPIVCTPEEAYRCFMRTNMDFLVIGNHLFEKKLQPSWPEKDNWQEEFKLD